MILFYWELIINTDTMTPIKQIVLSLIISSGILYIASLILNSFELTVAASVILLIMIIIIAIDKLL